MDLTLQDEEFDDRYSLRGRMEILNCLNDLIRHRENVTVYFNQGKDFILTTLLEASAEHLLFDRGGDDAANKRLERAQSCVMTAVHEGIRTQFSSTWTPQRYLWGDAKVFRIPLPQKIIRLQRREAYRVELAVNKPVVASLFNEEGVLLAALPIHDISVGGVGLNMVAGKANLSEGDRLEIEFSVQSGRPVRCHAQVRHLTPMGKAGGHPNLRVGLCFLDLEQSVSARIQRYILQVEHQRAALVRKG
jgi:c-di-GMP-binding flagellar brake protein YcgR